MPSKWNGAEDACMNAANSGPSVGVLEQRVDELRRRGPHLRRGRGGRVDRAPSGRSSLPKQWSPLPCVFIAASIGLRSVIGAHRVEHLARESRSKSVSTSSDVPSAAISPALLQPQPPSGCR